MQYLSHFQSRILRYLNSFLARTSGLFGSFITLLVGLIFPTVLPGARTSYSPFKLFFCLWVAWILRAIFNCTLRLLRGIGLEIPSDHMRRNSLSFNFSCLSWTQAFAAKITFSISTSKHMPVSIHCSSVIYDLPGMVSSSKKNFFYNLNFYCLTLWSFLKLVFYIVYQNVLRML